VKDPPLHQSAVFTISPSSIMRSTSRPRYPPPIILPAVRADIPELVRVHVDALHADLLTILQFPSPEKFTRAMIKLLDENFDAPQLLIMKALDAETKEITAMAIWQLKGYDPKELGVDHSNFGAASKLFRPQDLSAGVLLANVQQEPQSAIGQYIQSQFTAFLDSWTKGTKYIYLALLMTDPRFQRRGIGTAMLNWGHERADRDDVPAILIASPVGHPLYQSVGWKDVSMPLQVDLKDWVQYAEKGDMGWGTYRFYYMLRLPKTAA